MVNNYPEYAAGVNYKKTDSNDVTHFYSAQVVADPSDDTIESKLIKDGVVISEGGGSSDLEYETGLFEPDEDIYGHWINFANTHATPPMYISFADTDISTIDVNTPNTAVSWSYVYLSNWADYPDGFNRAGVTQSVYTLNDAISGTQAGMEDPTPNFATNEKFSPYGANATKVFRAGRSYKWIAIWTPTTNIHPNDSTPDSK